MALPVEDRAKRPVTPIAGPYGHPFHPILVTVPIGAWIASLVLDVATKTKSPGYPGLVTASEWLIAIGVLGALLAAVFGFLDLLAIPRGTRAFAVALTHMVINVAVLGAFIGNFVWRHSSATGAHVAPQVQPGQLALSAVSIAVLGVSGYLGGMLAYRYGVRVADERMQSEGFAAR